MKQSEQIGQLALALSKAQSQFNGAAKTSDNPFFKSKYADLFECIEAAKPALAANELAVVQTTDTDDKGIWVYTTLIHSSGEWAQGRILMKPKKDDDQATGSSITYGRRYGFAAIVGLAQKDDDGNESAGVVEEKKTGSTKIDKPKPTKKEESPPPAGREVIQQWLDWVDRFASANIDVFLSEWEQHGTKALKVLPPEHAKELQRAKAEIEKLLMEKK